MRLTEFTDYTLRVLIFCASNPERSITIAELAQTYGVSRNHLMKVVNELSRRGLIQTTRGRGGGLRLLKPAAEIGIGDVVRHAEPDFRMVECFDPKTNTCTLSRHCKLESVISRALKGFMAELDQVTLADLLPRAPAAARGTGRVIALISEAGAGAKKKKEDNMTVDVLVIGGGNAALCAALMAAEAGASVMLLEAAPREWRGGNSVHTRNLRCMHDAPQDVLVDAYPEEEFWQDLLKVTGGITDEKLARLTIRASSNCRGWMYRHGVRFQPSLAGALHTARTNAFFLGGGKALVNAYYRSAQKLGVQVRYESPVERIEVQDGRFVAAWVGQERITAKTCVLAAGGLESNIEWMRELWGQNERGEWPVENFLIRGTRYNRGVLIRQLLELGADRTGDPTQAHMVAIDARAPLYDGGISTRLDTVTLGVMLNREARRFYDEGEDFWPKRYAIWGRLIALQPGQIGYSIIDAKAIGRFMPSVFTGIRADSLPELARKLELDETTFMQSIHDFNQACRPGHFDHTVLDDCRTEGLDPPKTHWALPIDTAPFYGYALRPGVTFTYLGLKTDETAAVHFSGVPSENLFVAGEMMAGNVLGKGYTAGVGMSIGTAFGRIAGTQAARAALAGAAHANA